MLILTSVPRIQSYFSYIVSNVCFVMYSQANAYSNHTWVSAASPSQSFIFEIKAFSYLLFLQASARLPETEREDLLIWSVRDINSSLGKDFVNSYTSHYCLKRKLVHLQILMSFYISTYHFIYKKDSHLVSPTPSLSHVLRTFFWPCQAQTGMSEQLGLPVSSSQSLPIIIV